MHKAGKWDPSRSIAVKFNMSSSVVVIVRLLGAGHSKQVVSACASMQLHLKVIWKCKIRIRKTHGEYQYLVFHVTYYSFIMQVVELIISFWIELMSMEV